MHLLNSLDDKAMRKIIVAWLRFRHGDVYSIKPPLGWCKYSRASLWHKLCYWPKLAMWRIESFFLRILVKSCESDGVLIKVFEMSSSLLLVNQDCFAERMARKSHEIQSRLASKANAVTSGPSDWFDKIRSEQEGSTFERHGSVAIVKVLGALDYHYSFWSWLFDSSCYKGITNSVIAAKNDSGINKIILHVDSCGGGSHGCEECSDAIYSAAEAKEVVAVIDPEAASAGYWMPAKRSESCACGQGGLVLLARKLA